MAKSRAKVKRGKLTKRQAKAIADAVVMLGDANAAIDCDALFQAAEVINALLVENCPIVRPTMTRATKKAVWSTKKI